VFKVRNVPLTLDGPPTPSSSYNIALAIPVRLCSYPGLHLPFWELALVPLGAVRPVAPTIPLTRACAKLNERVINKPDKIDSVCAHSHRLH